MKTCKLAILFSGNGSNMQNLIESLHDKTFTRQKETNTKQEIKLEISLTLCNNPQAYGITRAQNLNIPCKVLNHEDFNSREAFDRAMLELLQNHQIDLCILAGFMRILTPTFTQKIPTINIHPSYLPAHKGMNAIKQSFDSGDGYGGVSVHWVNEELDGGEIILQKKLSIEQSDTLQSFEAKIYTLEHSLYPQAILKALNIESNRTQSL